MVVEYDCPIARLSSHREKINLEILRLQESEELVTWKRRWWVDKGQCSGESSQVRAAQCTLQYLHSVECSVLCLRKLHPPVQENVFVSVWPAHRKRRMLCAS